MQNKPHFFDLSPKSIQYNQIKNISNIIKFVRLLKYALKNTIRNPFLSLSSILVISLLIFFINTLFFIEYVTTSLTENINDRMSLSLNLKPGYTGDNSEVIAAISALKQASPSVSIEYLSKEEAFEILKKRDQELVRIIEGDKENPLPSSIVIKNIPLGEYPQIDTIVKRFKGIIQYNEERSQKSLVDYHSQYERIQGLINILLSIRYGIYGIISLFIFSVFIIIYNSIGNFVFFYRDEIKIIRLVGGENIFIYGPFSIQGFLYTLAAYALGTSVFVYLIKNINFSLITDFPLFIDRFFVLYGNIFLIELAVVTIVGVLSGFLSSRRFIGKGEFVQ
ncbi:MAG: Cell division protein [uncultured bacterium (gcode 4)]|uniref:Cell division protein FtsX n=1 Tax=uncultured bacterium (gcode 4) TaxID=1234023 RepID=K1YAE1_9BACT|nr:MAG: Cell division protein [uncultured bacterium (gcode 4)]